jgi:hypothetical protein
MTILTSSMEAAGARGSPRMRRGRLFAIALALLVLGGLGWAALAPITAASHNELFEIPKGTFARRMAGDKVEILPQTIWLTLGLNDVLLLKNSDVVPHVFGPTLIMPGQSFSLPFAKASTYSFACTAHASGQLQIIVEPPPSPGWETLRWRLRKLINTAWHVAGLPVWHAH